MTTDDKRAQFVADLRAFADLLETTPVLPTPNFNVHIWAFLRKDEGAEVDRFNTLHDFADAYGLKVTEDDKRDRRAETRFGAVEYTVHAFADGQPPDAESRIVSRPGAQSGGVR